MGTIIDLPAACTPFTLEARSESICLSDGVALAETRQGTDPITGATAPALQATCATYAGPGMFRVDREHLPALLATLEVALAQPFVVETLRATSQVGTSIAELDGTEGPGLTVSTESITVYGHAAGSALDGPLPWGPCSTVEVLHVDLRAIVAVLADEVETR